MISSLSKRFRSIWSPSAFQGWGRVNGYFEGWYFKLVSADQQHAFALIPGIAHAGKGASEESHSFLQILDGIQNTADYLRFPVESFRPQFKAFELKLDKNVFSDRRLALDHPQISGALSLSTPYPWPVRPLAPGIMGPYAFVPFMECYHGIVSMYSTLEGSLTINGKEIDFSGGNAYLEKDWGRSFPSSWIWMQSSHFEEKRVSFNVSVAKIPWLGSSFVGFIGWLWIDGTLHGFTTWSGGKMRRTAVEPEKVFIDMENRTHKISVIAHRKGAAELVAPVQGMMQGKVSESMTSLVEVQLIRKSSGKVEFEGTGENTGLEVGGNYPELLT